MRQTETNSWLEALYDFYSGILVGSCHFATVLRVVVICDWYYALVLRPMASLFGVHQPLHHEEEGEQTLKVMAVGYGRTGTVGFREANRRL
jgi:hypothetical protein